MIQDTKPTHPKSKLRKFDSDDTFAGDDLVGPDEAIEGEESMDDFIGDYLGGIQSPNSGTIAKGTIVKITESEVYVDINMKTEGVIALSEFQNDAAPKLGDPVEVLIVKIDEQEGNITVSKNKARLIKAWDLADEAAQKGHTIKARIVAKVKGGLSADFNGLKAFVPGSLMSLQQEYDLEKYVSQEFDFKIIELNRRRRNMVLSRKAILEEERKRVVADIFQRLKPGDVCEGRIKNITDYGAFVSLEGGKIDGLLHKADMSWAHVRDINKVLKVGDTIQVKVLHIDKENEKISLGLKQLRADPWTRIDEIIEVGQVVEGQVKNVTHFGAFVEIQEGIEGLVHISDMSWTERVRHPKELVNIDDKVMVKVLNIDTKERKIALGMKQVKPDPWSLVRDNYQVGEVVTGQVKNLTDFGAFVELAEGVEGLVHISDLTWTGRVKHPSEILNTGDSVEVKILELDPDNKRISLGLKQVNPDPWEIIEDTYSAGQTVRGRVKKLTDFGAFVELPDGIEGLVHVSDFSWTERVEKPADVLKEGQEVEVKVLDVNPNERKMSLGLKQLNEEPWAAVDKKFMMGQIVEGTISKLANFGAFVALEKGVEGLVHVSDFSWTERITHPQDKVKEGDKVKVKILNIDRHERKISLGIKQVEADPMESYLKAHPVGSVVKGTVSSMTDFGAFVKLDENLEGLVHSSQISDQRDKRPEDLLKVGQEVTVKLVEVDRKERRLRLSMRQAQVESERAAMREVQERFAKEDSNALGDRLDEKTREKLRKARKDAAAPTAPAKKGEA